MAHRSPSIRLRKTSTPRSVGCGVRTIRFNLLWPTFRLVTDRTVVSRPTAEVMVSEVMATEGHFVGTSSGAVLQAAVDILEAEGGTGVALLPDAGWKYLSGPPWTPGI